MFLDQTYAKYCYTEYFLPRLCSLNQNKMVSIHTHKPKSKEQIRNLNTLHSNPFPVQLYHKHKNCILIRSNPLQQRLRV